MPLRRDSVCAAHHTCVQAQSKLIVKLKIADFYNFEEIRSIQGNIEAFAKLQGKGAAYEAKARFLHANRCAGGATGNVVIFSFLFVVIGLTEKEDSLPRISVPAGSEMTETDSHGGFHGEGVRVITARIPKGGNRRIHAATERKGLCGTSHSPVVAKGIAV